MYQKAYRNACYSGYINREFLQFIYQTSFCKETSCFQLFVCCVIYLFVFFFLTSTLWNTGPLFNSSCFFQVIEITDYRAQLYDYLKNRMTAIAPNLTVLVGELVGARLIAHAG